MRVSPSKIVRRSHSFYMVITNVRAINYAKCAKIVQLLICFCLQMAEK